MPGYTASCLNDIINKGFISINRNKFRRFGIYKEGTNAEIYCGRCRKKRHKIQVI